MPCFFFFFSIFLCREYLGGAQQRTGDAVSLWDGRRPLFFAVRHILRTTKAYAVRCLSQRRTAKVFAGQKCTVRPLPCARPDPHGKGCVVRVLASAVLPWRTAKRANPVVDSHTIKLHFELSKLFKWTIYIQAQLHKPHGCPSSQQDPT
jgi:hypothetical protein